MTLDADVRDLHAAIHALDARLDRLGAPPLPLSASPALALHERPSR